MYLNTYRLPLVYPSVKMRFESFRYADSDVLMHLPVVDIDYVFADRAIVDKAERWLEIHRDKIIKSTLQGDTEWIGIKNAVLAYFLQELLRVPLGSVSGSCFGSGDF